MAHLDRPGLLREPGLADRLEADVRRRGERTGDGARALWEGAPGRWTLDDVDALRDAPDTAALLDRLTVRLERLFAAPHKREAPVMEGAELDDPRAFRAGHAALTDRGRIIAALLAAGPGAIVSHGTAAHVWSLTSSMPPFVHVTRPAPKPSALSYSVSRPRRREQGVAVATHTER